MESAEQPAIPIITVEGEKVALGPRRRDLLSTFVRWINDFDVTRSLALGMRPISNERAIRAYQRAGFREAGRIRECHRLGQKFYDVLLMDCLSTEFDGSYLRRLLPGSGDER